MAALLQRAFALRAGPSCGGVPTSLLYEFLDGRGMRPVLVLALALALLAGCFGQDEAPAERSFTAAGGSSSNGWAYDGAGLTAAGATLDGRVSNVDNTGIVNVSFQHAGSTWVVTFDAFAQAADRTFMDGGVAFDLDEHGDTGVADASIPRIHAIVAAWGTAKVMRDGVLATPEPWAAHLMVSRDTVRGPDGKIAKADGTTPYDPSAAGDARRIENDPQALMFLKHPQGETFSREPVAASETLTCSGPQCVQSAEVAFDTGAASIQVNVSILPMGPAPAALGQGNVRVVDAAGTELGTAAFQALPNAPVLVPFVIDPATAIAPLTVEVSGAGAYSALVDSVVAYDDVPFIVLTWDEVTIT